MAKWTVQDRGRGARAAGTRRRWSVVALGLLVAGLVVSVLPLPAAAAARPAPVPAPAPDRLPVGVPAGPDGVPVAPDEATAVAAAAATGGPVVIGALTDPYTRHLANPDGTRTFEQYLEPQRVRRGTGWVPVDTTLRRSGDRLVPGATLLDMSFSAGGPGELVSLADGPVRLGLSWPGPLPEPALAGDTATYPEVLPGVDLVVRAGPDSFAQMLVVKHRRAAANPALARVAWGVTTDGLTLRTRPDGVVEAVDGTGEVTFRAPAPLMWDTPAPAPAPGLWPAGETWSQADPAGPGMVRAMPVQAGAGELAVRPDLAVLADPATRYPVMIDPSFGKGVANWSPVNKADPNRSYPSGTGWPRDYVRVGETWGEPGLVFRSHLRFSISSMDGQDLVGNPSFHITLDHSASCGSTPVELWRTSTIGSSGNVTWNSMKSKWLHGGPLQTRSAHANEGGGCGSTQPDAPMEFSNSNIRTRLQGAMNAGNGSFTFGLRAPNESDDFQWKRFTRSSAKLTAVYNRKPNAPTSLAITGSCYPGACSSPAIVRTRRPTLRAKVTDPNGDTMRVRFEVRNSSKSSVVAATEQVTGVSSGSSPTWRTPTLPQESQFHFRVRAKDGVGWGGWSGYYTFYVDTQAPGLPVVTGDPYQHKDTGTYNGGVGQPGSFTFDPAGSDDVVSYQWRINGGTVTTVNVAKGAAGSDDITPTADLEQLLEVRSIDHAGNTSAWRAHPFYVRPQPVDVAYWKFDEGAGGTAGTASGNPDYAGTLHGGAGWTASQLGLIDPAASGTALSLDGSDDYVEVPRVLATNHAAGFSVSAWVRPDVLDNYHTVVAQHGANTYAFRLYHKPETGQWCFRVRHADDVASGNSAVCAPATPQAGVWTHLAAMYDRPAGQLRIYVNGGPNVFDPEFGQGTADAAAAPDLWAAEGAFTVGRRMLEGAEWFDGRIDEVRVYQRVLAGSDVAEMFASCRFGTCPEEAPVTGPVLVGAWDLDEGTGTGTADTSGLGGDATLTGGVSWLAGGYGSPAAVSFDGASGAVETGGPVLLTDQSFTVSAWARVVDLDSWQAVVSQDGEAMSPFRLSYHRGDDAWCFRVHHADQWEPVGHTTACGPQPQVGQWTHLVGVYDAAALEIRLYVDGELVDTASHPAAGWRASGPLTIGRTMYTQDTGAVSRDFFGGDIDLVRAYQGALTSSQVADLHAGQLDRTPVPVIDTPAGSLAWQAGDQVSFSGHATDPQGSVPAAALRWQLRLVDCTAAPCQTELLDEWTGVAAGTFTAPDVPYPAHLELELTAENGPDWSGSTVRQLDPATVDLTFTSEPAGLALTVDSVPEPTPFVRTVIRGAGVVLGAASPQDLAGSSYVFGSWSDGGDQAHEITAPAAPAELTASFQAVLAEQPTAVIDTPSPGLAWQAGQEIGFSGHATDAAGPLPDSALSWQLRLVDCTVAPCQTEVLDDWIGVAAGSFVAPDIAAYPAQLELELTADNGPGFADTTLLQLDPATVDLTFASDPAGLELTVNAATGVAPFTRTVVQGAAVAVAAPSPQDLGGAGYAFQSWSDGGAQAHGFPAPATAATWTASYATEGPGTACGTDGFGHVCSTGPEPFEPAPDLLPLTGDDAFVEVALPFPMWLYGEVYRTAWVDTNGLVTFIEPEAPSPSAATIPAPYQWGEADAALYPFWQDWLVDGSAGVHTGLHGAAPDRRFVVEWRDVTTTADPTVRVSFQAVLHEDGQVTFAWDGVDPVPAEQGTGGVVGIENNVGTDALAFSQFTAALASGQGVRFTPPAPGTVSGVVTSGETGGPLAEVPVTLYPGGWGTVTDETGGYEFTGVPAGTHGAVAHGDDGRCAGPGAGAPVTVPAGTAVTADLTVRSGADGSGNTCTEGPQPFLPTTDVLALTGYFGSEEVPLPFPVRLYGEVYDTAWVDIEGVVTFQEPGWNLDNVSPIPSTEEWGKANAAVYPFWSNWMAIDGATIRTGTVGTAPDRQFVIEWRDVMADPPPHPRASFQVVFHESSGDISVAWDGINDSLLGHGSDAVVGIENADGTDALVYSQFIPALMSGQGVHFDLRGENLAAGVPTIASGACGTEDPEYAVDGLPGTKWCTTSDPSWLELDLGAATAIGNVTIRHSGAGGEDPAWNSRDFLLLVSDDGLNWTTVAEVAGNTADVTFHDLTVSGRYLRLDVLTPAGGGETRTRIYELEVYADPVGPAPPPPEPTGNLAWARPATASGACGSEGPEYAVNGSWSGGDKWCSSGGAGWLEVDLGSVTGIGNVTIHHSGAGGEDPAWNTRDFRVQVSDDGLNWTTAAEVTGNTADVTSHDMTVSGRYVRLAVLVPTSDGDTRTRIYEFEVYADPVGPPPPPPPPTGNLAWGQPVAADHSCGTADQQYAVDGSLATGSNWCSTGSPSWLEVDLGSVTGIGNVTIHHSGAGGEDPVWNTRDFRVQVSDDRTSWTTVADVTGNTADVTSHDLTASGRYVRLEVLTPASDGDFRTRIYELEVYA